MRCFVLLLGASAVCGACAAAVQHPSELALVVLMPAYVLWITAYVLWIICDLRARRVFGCSFAFQLIVSLLPFCGLLIYLVWTRRLVGILQWLAFVAALYIPAGMAAFVSRAVVQVARGERL